MAGTMVHEILDSRQAEHEARVWRALMARLAPGELKRFNVDPIASVDYSLDLFEEFQRLRTYRKTRFAVDPAGFEVATDAAGVREEKIDLPPSCAR